MEYVNITQNTKNNKQHQTTVIFDIDGVIADATHRNHHITKPNNNWDEFFQDCENDTQLTHNTHLLQLLAKHNNITLLTSRPKAVKKQTTNWLTKNNIPWNTLIMRSARNDIPSANYKKLAIQQLIEQNTTIEIVFDDDPKNIAEIKKLGINAIYIHSGYYTS